MSFMILGILVAHVSRSMYSSPIELERARLQHQHPRLDLREVEDRVEQPQEGARRGMNIVQIISQARGQLELIENTFRLLADQIVTMRSPTELSGQLDELLDGVEAVRQTTRETDRLLQAVER